MIGRIPLSIKGNITIIYTNQSKCTFEYVASGIISYKGLCVKKCIEPRENQRLLGEILEPIDHDTHQFSMLYNGFTEANLAHIAQSFREYGSVRRIHVDSGGLQMITRAGAGSAPALRDGVFRNQAEFGDVAMCFDELPVITKTETALMSDYKSRLLDVKNFDDYAIRTAGNIKDQIKVFRETGTTSKIYVIAQGNSAEWYQRWMEIICDNLTDSDLQYISGIAYSPTSCGMGEREVMEQIYAMSKIDIPDHIKKNVHLLGMGSYKRILPYAILAGSGYFDGYHISYDSTSHTMARSTAKHLGVKWSVLRQNQSIKLEHETRIREAAAAYTDPRILELIDAALKSGFMLEQRNEHGKSIGNKFGDTPFYVYVYEMLEFKMTIDMFIKRVNRIISNPNDTRDEIPSLMMPLIECKTPADIQHYVKMTRNYLRSRAVESTTDYENSEVDLLADLF